MLKTSKILEVRGSLKKISVRRFGFRKQGIPLAALEISLRKYVMGFPLIKGRL
jgi:hypothetical protein